MVFMEKIGKTLTSMEVAEMIGREHNELLKTIRRFVSQMEKIAVGENSHGSKSEYFEESTYEDANGQRRPCFNVTKKGCEFIAHKMNGIKGTEFTMRYIDRFHKMEEAVFTPQLPNDPMKLLKIHYEALEQVDKKVDDVREQVNELDKKLDTALLELPLLGPEADEISNAVKKRVVHLLGGKESNAYHDKSLAKKVFIDCYQNLKHNFGDVTTYKAIRRKDSEKAIEVVKNYTPPVFLADQIETANAKQRIDV